MLELQDVFRVFPSFLTAVAVLMASTYSDVLENKGNGEVCIFAIKLDLVTSNSAMREVLPTLFADAISSLIFPTILGELVRLNLKLDNIQDAQLKILAVVPRGPLVLLDQFQHCQFGQMLCEHPEVR